MYGWGVIVDITNVDGDDREIVNRVGGGAAELDHRFDLALLLVIQIPKN